MPRKHSESLTLFLSCTLFIHLFCNQFLFVWGLNHDMELLMRIVLALNLPVVAISCLIFNLSRVITQREMEREMEEQETGLRLEQSYQMILSLEAQRHDFRNHLQVIRTLAGIGKLDEIARYVDECGVTLNSLADMSRIGHTVLQALFLSFQSRMRGLGIKFEVTCDADLTRLACPPGHLTRIVANILENALEAVSLQKTEPIISVAIRSEADLVHFVFWNNGPAIPPQELPHIFDPGFSKKTGEHRGYGLYIVQTLLGELGGRITVHSNEVDGTEFHVLIPNEAKNPSNLL